MLVVGGVGRNSYSRKIGPMCARVVHALAHQERDAISKQTSHVPTPPPLPDILFSRPWQLNSAALHSTVQGTRSNFLEVWCYPI